MLLLCCRSKKTLNLLIALLMLTAPFAVAQKQSQKTRNSAAPKGEKKSAHNKTQRDPAITQIIKDVSPQRVQQTIEKLVTFGTRSTLSVNNPDAATSAQGIVAA